MIRFLLIVTVLVLTSGSSFGGDWTSLAACCLAESSLETPALEPVPDPVFSEFAPDASFDQRLDVLMEKLETSLAEMKAADDNPDCEDGSCSTSPPKPQSRETPATRRWRLFK